MAEDGALTSDVMDPLVACNAAPRSLAVKIMGPYFVGWQVNVMLGGFVVAWYVSYYGTERYKRDTLRVKAAYWTVFFTATICCLLNVFEQLWWSTMPERDEDTLWKLFVWDCLLPIPGAFCALAVQSYLANRASHFIASRPWRRTFNIGMGLLIFLAFAANITLVVTSFKYRDGTLEALAPYWSYNKSVAFWLWPTAIADVGISVALFVSLRKAQVGFNLQTDRVLRRLSLLALRTGSYTSFAAIMGAITCSAFPDTSIYCDITAAFYLPLPSFYALSLITTLNSRNLGNESSRPSTSTNPRFVPGASFASGGAAGPSKTPALDGRRKFSNSSQLRPKWPASFVVSFETTTDVQEDVESGTKKEKLMLAPDEVDEELEQPEDEEKRTPTSGWLNHSRNSVVFTSPVVASPPS